MAPERVVITDAAHPHSLDVDARQRRYLWSMLVRVVCILLVLVVPGLWAKAACIVGAAIIPAVAVLLANASDNHRLPEQEAPDRLDLPQLAAGQTVPGEVVEG